jgi:prepilin-type N-terminal cleavage/methylation domain-containing protein
MTRIKTECIAEDSIRVIRADSRIRVMKKGFTLIEMVVVLTIFSFIAITLFVKNSEFSAKVLLTNLAYEVALSVRQAQVYGLSARELNPGSDQFNIGYGVNFNANSGADYIFFADVDEDGFYDGGSELLETFSFKRGNRVGHFCATPVIGLEKCSNSFGSGTLTMLHITFKRPNPDAIIQTNLAEAYKSAKIFVTAPSGEERTVTIEQTGQISIE